jgi:hypothetical protein
MDLVIHIYLKDFHDIATPPSVKIYVLVDFKFLVQLISLYPSSTMGNQYSIVHSPLYISNI